MNDVCIIIAIAAYLIGMIYIGIRFSNQNKTSEDFYLGGRKMGPLVVAMSAEASDMSSWLLMGLPGVAYLSGVCSAFWTAAGLAIGTWLNWFFVARRLRRYSSNIKAITVPDFLAKRFHDKRNIITAVAALVIVIFFIPYTASGFAACGKLFHSLFGADYMTAMIPTNFNFNYSAELLTEVIIGGTGSFTGSIIGAAFLSALPEAMRQFSIYRMLAYSIVLVLVMIFKPGGIFGTYEFSLTRVLKKLAGGELFKGKKKGGAVHE